MDIGKSDMIVSLAGRDKGQYFFVVEATQDFLFVADGKGRKLEKPKRKNRKHIQIVPGTDSRVAEKIRNGDKVLNSELRRELAVISQKLNSQNQGG